MPSSPWRLLIRQYSSGAQLYARIRPRVGIANSSPRGRPVQDEQRPSHVDIEPFHAKLSADIASSRHESRHGEGTPEVTRPQKQPQQITRENGIKSNHSTSRKETLRTPPVVDDRFHSKPATGIPSSRNRSVHDERATKAAKLRHELHKIAEAEERISEDGSSHHESSRAEAPQPSRRTSDLRKLPQSPRSETNPSSVPKLVHEIPPSLLYQHWDIAPPTQADLQAARQFFDNNPVKTLFTAPKLLEIPFTSTPEVVFLGRSNVGKSSLVNSLLGEALAKTSHKPGKTKSMNAYSIGGKLTLVDMPGYGKGSREEWGDEIMKYLTKRKELRRVFVIVDAIKEHDEAKIKRDDSAMLHALSTMKIPHQVIIGKVDRTLFPPTWKVKLPMLEGTYHIRAKNMGKIFDAVKEHIMLSNPPPFGQLLGVSAMNPKGLVMSKERKGALGIDALKWAILVATGHAKASSHQQ